MYLIKFFSVFIISYFRNDSAVRECEKYMNQRDSLASKEDI